MLAARKMSQDEIVLRHLQEVGSITCMEAHMVYKIRSLTSVIARLKRRKGLIIESILKKDLNGQRYVRYKLQRKGRKTLAAKAS